MNTVYGRPSRVRTPSGVGEQVGLGHERRGDPAGAQRLDKGRVVAGLVGLESAGPDDGAGGELHGELDHAARGVAALEEQPRAEATQVAVEAPQRVPEPPARRASRRPGAALPRLPDVDGQQRAAAVARGLRGGGERGIVAEPQVAAQPEDGGRRIAAARCRSSWLLGSRARARRDAL